MRRVEIYRNLHTGTWSLRDLDGIFKGRVTEHPTSVFLRNARFVVQPRGREKVRAEGRKNVHAFVRGDLVWWAKGHPHPINDEEYRKASYNPYQNDTFVDVETGNPLSLAGRVLLDTTVGVWYAEPNEGA